MERLFRDRHEAGRFLALKLQKYEGNKDGLLEIYNLFNTELPIYINELKALKESKNKDGIRKQIHKMKSPLGLVASTDLLNCLNQLQQAEVLDKSKLRNQLIDKVIEHTVLIEREIGKRLNEKIN